MIRSVHTIIDEDKCVGCGACVRVCPKETLAIVSGKARVVGNESINCGHCAAACPEEAVTVTSLPESVLAFQGFDVKQKWIPHGQYDTAHLVQLMLSRRSCRNYANKPVSGELLKDLVRIAITAPSGSNKQPWTFTILPNREAVKSLGSLIAVFFKKLNKTARKAWLRNLLRMMGRKELHTYFHEYYLQIDEKIKRWESQGHDPLFWNAPAVIVIGTNPEASCPKEDALMAAQNLLLGAHSMGLGTCAIGYAVAAMNRDQTIQQRLDIPLSETVQAVIAVGHPNETYQWLCGRKPVTLRVSQGQ